MPPQEDEVISVAAVVVGDIRIGDAAEGQVDGLALGEIGESAGDGRGAGVVHDHERGAGIEVAGE